jgi:hypothetical protein
MTYKQAEEALLREQGFIPVRLAAKSVFRSPTRIYEALDMGHVDGKCIGRSRYVRWSSLLQWVDRNDASASKALGLSPDKLPETKTDEAKQS